MDYKQIADNSMASQGKAELLWLLNKLSKIQPKVIVEIGVHLGHSLAVWQRAFKPEILIGIDIDINRELLGYLEGELSNVEFIQASSRSLEAMHEVSAILGPHQIDFLFIDGDHEYHAVKRDFLTWLPFVRKGGIIAFHDALIKDHPLVDAYKYFEGLKTEYEWDSCQIDANGVGLVYV